MSRPKGRHRARRVTGIHALRRPAVAATAAISTVSVAAAAYSSAASASASVAGTAEVKVVLAAPTSSTALRAAAAGVTTDARGQVAAASRAVSARAAAHARAKAAAAKKAAAVKKAADAKKAAAKKAAATKSAATKAAATKPAAARATAPDTSRDSTRPSYSGSPQVIASAMLGSYGWGQDQMGCLVSLWNRESSWNAGATNPSSGAYGIPQSLPGSKMASAGADWRTNPATQIRWGLGYIRATYGSPCGAWGHSQATGWY